jgi:acetoin utilization protein AcuC
MLLVFGPRSTDYDFGSSHPLTPRRFGPGIDLLRSLGAEPGLAPEPVSDEELGWCHSSEYLEVVRRFSADPFGFPEAGIGEGPDNPPFAGMHEVAAAVAGGSSRAVEAILRGDVEHAFHPGGGLHHAMRARASGFCIYNDPALAIARARRDGLRVLYIDLDVHHGDGVQALFWDDPGVLTFSIHETTRTLFPWMGGEAWEIGDGAAAGTSVNVPLLPGVGERAWLQVLRDLLPALAASFGPDLIVSQHGADSHAWDPLAHLNVTTTAHGEAARLVDAIAHRHAGGRWLATGGGGYDAYRVVPRTWALAWLAGSHREAPASTPAEWRDRWAEEAARYGQSPLPETFDDEPNAGFEFGSPQEAAEGRSVQFAALVRQVIVPRLIREAEDRGWWEPSAPPTAQPGAPDHATGSPVIVPSVDADAWSRLTLAPWVIPPAAPSDGHAIVLAGLRDGARVAAATIGSRVIGMAVVREGELLAIGVGPDHRRQGLGRELIEAVAPDLTRVEVTVAERDPFDPLPASDRAAIGRALLARAGLEIESADDDVRSIDPAAIVGVRR